MKFAGINLKNPFSNNSHQQASNSCGVQANSTSGTGRNFSQLPAVQHKPLPKPPGAPRLDHLEGVDLSAHRGKIICYRPEHTVFVRASMSTDDRKGLYELLSSAHSAGKIDKYVMKVMPEQMFDSAWSRLAKAAAGIKA